MLTAVFPGTFDPITIGHTDLIHRASRLCDKLIIAIAESSSKRTLFTLDERIELTGKVLADRPNITVVGYNNLTIDFLKENNINVMFRGLRNSIDYEYEKQLANTYLSQLPNLEIIFLNTKLQYSFISSSIVKDIAIHGGSINQYVSPLVEEAVKNKIRRYK